MAFIGNLPGQSSFGGRIGGDISEVLQGLAHQKAQNLKFKNNRDFLQSLGFHPQVAGPLSRQSDEQIGGFLKQLEGFNVSNPPQQNPQGYQQAMQGLTPQQQSQGFSQNQPNIPNQYMQNQQQNVPGMDQGQAFQSTMQGQQGGMSPAQIGQLQEQQAQQQLFNQPGQQQQPSGIRSKSNPADARMAVQKRREEHEAMKHERDRQEKHQEESRTYRKELNTQRKELREDSMRLTKMKDLIKTGKLTNPSFHSAITAAGEGILGPHVGLKFDLKHLESSESQEFEKLSTDFVKGVKNIFGGNVGNQATQTFLNTIPNLKQSNQAKAAVINNMEVLLKGKELRATTAEKIIKENKGLVPADLEFMIEERIEPQLEKLAEKFRKGVDKQKVMSEEYLVQSVLRAVPKLF